VLAVRCVKSVPRWLLLKALGPRFPRLATSRLGLLQLADVAEPPLPTPRWVRVRPRLSGICGSDLAALAAEGTPFFAPLTSFPFTFGHEVVGTVTEVGAAVRDVRVGDRVVVEPVLHCTVRGIAEPCAACRRGDYGNCANVTAGDIAAGVQTGYCRDTGGGWSHALVAHEVQLHRVPDGVPDDAAVLVEPFSCALHAVLRAAPVLSTKDSVLSTQNILIFGCGTMGLLVLAALRALQIPAHVVALAKHAHQQEQARRLGADAIVVPGKAAREQLCRHSGATLHFAEIGPPTVLGGFDVVFDCVGSPRSLDESLRFTTARGRTLLVGMPAVPKTVDWTTIWYKELQVRGTYTYGVEDVAGERLRTFPLALRLLEQGRVDLRPLVTHRFALADYRTALQTARHTGPQRAIKTVFDLTRGPTP
jgi:threonine dehydrogenase-like Zn-dependent dehydrogenase